MLQAIKKGYFGEVLHLSEIYNIHTNPHENQYTDMYSFLNKRFANLYGQEPSRFIRLPGSVNLFETDSNKLSFSIEQDIIFAFVETKEPKIIINTTQSTAFPKFEIDIDPTTKFPDDCIKIIQNKFLIEETKVGSYQKSIVMGYKAAQLKENYKGIKICIAINQLPNKLGLGFHNALSLGICIIALFVNKQLNIQTKHDVLQNFLKIKKQFTNIQQRNEFVQLFSIKDSVCKQDETIMEAINQNQFQDIYFPFFKKYCFIIADTLTPEPTLYVLKKKMNKRFAEVIVGLNLLQSKLDMKDSQFETIQQFQQLLGYTDQEMIDFLKENLKNDFYSIPEVEKECKEKVQVMLKQLSFQELFLEAKTQFHPLNKLMYQINEKQRVEQASFIFQSQSNDDEKAKLIGNLMNKSFKDGQDLLGLDSEEINTLHKEFQAHGALGIKQIGTTWGGALIGLFQEVKAQKVIEDLQDQYYNNPQKKLMISDDLSNYVFKTVPSIGAVMLNPEYEIWF